MIYLGRFPNISPAQRRVLIFDFGPVLADYGSGVTIVGTPVWSCAVDDASAVADPSASARLSSDPAIVDAVTKTKTSKVFMEGAVNGVDYMIYCLVETSDGQKVEHAANLLCKRPA